MTPATTMTDVEMRFWGKVRIGDGCWEWQAAIKKGAGYGVFGVSTARRAQRAHRVAYELANGPIPDGMLVCHRCDNPRCVRPSHLFLGTAADNSADMVSKDRQVRGDLHHFRRDPSTRPTGDRNGSRRHPERRRRGEEGPNAKLTAEQVREIRTLASSGLGARPIAERFGVSRTLVRLIVARRTWRHVP